MNLKLLRLFVQKNLEDKSVMMDNMKTMDQTEELLKELRAWVKQRRGNQELLRRALGISKQSVSAWVTGESRPSLETGLQLMAFLKSHRSAKAQELEGLGKPGRGLK
jgi:DNA-binding XRE family transcriptional regulator